MNVSDTNDKTPTLVYKITLAVCSILLLTLFYSNHFHNPFEFDDEHTIVNNASIRNLKNIPSFFTDATTTSSLPKNQAYRPGLTTLNTIDYAIGGKEVPDPFYYHISIFLSLLVLGVCLFRFICILLKPYTNSEQNFLWSLFLSLLFCIHTANSQTINYIIARADSFSTLMVLLAFLMYIRFPLAKKYFLYLIPVVIGFSVKEPAIMFVPLLMVYQLLFESAPANGKHPFHYSAILNALKRNIIPLLLIAFLYFFSQHLTPKTWDSGNADRWAYLISQPFAIIHYFNNFFLPFNLVIDTDWELLDSISDDRFIVGTAFILLLVIIIFKTAQKHPVAAFGLSWFLLALAPTSSIIPLSEVLNDHRPFFAYIGLCLSSVYGLIWVYKNYNATRPLKSLYLTLLPFILILHGIGTYRQNSIWHSSESVWKEATIKAPKNGRAWMNYGISLMARAAYPEAQAALEKAKQLWPYYPYLYINTGILNSAINKNAEAETDFLKAKALDNQNPEVYVYYSRFLMKMKRYPEAIRILNSGLQLSPAHTELNRLKAEAELMANAPEDIYQLKLKEAAEKVKLQPNHETYLELSLAYYTAGQFEECIKACETALTYKADYALAYNNICSAYNQLKQWDKAIEAGQKGLQIDPQNELLKGNLNIALNNKGK